MEMSGHLHTVVALPR